MNKRRHHQLLRAGGGRIGERELYAFAEESLTRIGRPVRRALIVPPDFTRSHSYGGRLTAMYYDLLKDRCDVAVMPALGTHNPLTDGEIDAFFGGEIPKDCYRVHNWRKDVSEIGEVPSEFVREATEGLYARPIRIEINTALLDTDLDVIISIGQVVPHEIAGMANYTKNILVGCGGEDIINQTHIIGAVYGMERLIGRPDNPVRKIFDYVQDHFLHKLPILYILTVTNASRDGVQLEGIFAGTQRGVFEAAAQCSMQKNITLLDRPVAHVVAYLDEEEFKSTWLGNKAIYRTRMAIADGGRLTVLAPGVRSFGEDPENDRIIRKYGYVGREAVLGSMRHGDMARNLSAAAHLIHGSADGRFQVEYAVKFLTRAEVEGVHYTYMDYEDAMRLYPVDMLTDGYNTLRGEEIYFVRKPALGLWAYRERFGSKE